MSNVEASRTALDVSRDARPVTARCADLLEQYPSNVIGEIADDDQMFHTENTDNLAKDFVYEGLGRGALDAIRLCMLAAQKTDVESFLDLPSGHGRILRLMKAEYPGARMAACDIIPSAVDFCARTFDAMPIYSTEHPADIDLTEQFDLIWCGSLLTHLDAPMWDEFLDFFESALPIGGLLVMTTNGRMIVPRLRDFDTGRWFLSDDERRARLLAHYVRKGFGFGEYITTPDQRAVNSEPSSYGVSLARPSWVMSMLERRPGLQLVSFLEGRWGDQDVYGCVRVGNVETAPAPVRVPLARSDTAGSA
jgi:SAM-dependent methyltransferase